MLISIETHITCDFPGESGTPIPPLDPHMTLNIFSETEYNLEHDNFQRKTVNILRRKSLVSTDTVCNNFVRQSKY